MITSVWMSNFVIRYGPVPAEFSVIHFRVSSVSGVSSALPPWA
jgi:hypothetical protein